MVADTLDDGLLPVLNQSQLDNWRFFSAETLQRFRDNATARGHAHVQTFFGVIQELRVVSARLRQAEARVRALEAEERRLRAWLDFAAHGVTYPYVEMELARFFRTDDNTWPPSQEEINR